MDLCAGSNGDADTQNRRVDTVGGGGGGGERGNIRITICETDSQWESAV